MMPLKPLALSALLSLPTLVAADEISDSLQVALDAYNEGDVAFALEELEFARQKIMALQADSFRQFLPEAPDGWIRDVDTDMAAGLAMMGGGMGAGAEYRNEDGSEYYSITMMADNPMVMSMGGMIANAGVMGMRLERIGRQRVAIGDDQAMTLVNNRILVTVDSDDPDLAFQAMQSIDFEALGSFGQ